MDEHNPLIPAGYDIVWSLLAAAVVTLGVTALIVLARSNKHLSTNQVLIWMLLILFVPVLGAVAWLAVARRSLAASSSQSEQGRFSRLRP